MNLGRLAPAASIVLLCAKAVAPAEADPRLVKESKDAGMPAQNCQYCHVSKVPKKDTFKAADDLNDRGKWLVAEKDKRKSKEVKGDWLKEFPGGKEQK